MNIHESSWIHSQCPELTPGSLVPKTSCLPHYHHNAQGIQQILSPGQPTQFPSGLKEKGIVLYVEHCHGPPLCQLHTIAHVCSIRMHIMQIMHVMLLCFRFAFGAFNLSRSCFKKHLSLVNRGISSFVAICSQATDKYQGPRCLHPLHESQPGAMHVWDCAVKCRT